MIIMLDSTGLEETSYIYVDNKMVTKACTHKMILFTRICTQTNSLYITPDLINQEHNRQSAAMICKKVTTFFINKMKSVLKFRQLDVSTKFSSNISSIATHTNQTSIFTM